MLGPLDAVGNGQAVALGGPKQRAVLAMLISRVGQAATNDQLSIDAFGERRWATMLCTGEHGFDEHVANGLHART